MGKSRAEISPVTSGKGLLEAWAEMSYTPPAPKDEEEETKKAWAEAVETSDHDILVARMGSVAVGFVDIKWTGPVRREQKFTEVLAATFPDQTPMPIAYSLIVHPYYRRMHIGDDLMDSAEKLVGDKLDAAPRIALNVKTTNDRAVPLYLKRGYEIIAFQGETEFELDYPDRNEAGDPMSGVEKVLFMTKDLSRLR